MRIGHPVWAGLLLVCTGLLAYQNSFRGPFIFDDIKSIRDNPHVRHLWPWDAPPQTTAAGRPIVSATLALNYALSGFDVWSYHAFNLCVHILAALALYGILHRTLQRPWLALGIALVWMVHPLQTGSVTYIIQRAESLMGLFYLVTLYCAIRGWHLPAIVVCALGMATKETMVTAPVMVLLYDRVFLAGSFREALRRRWELYAGLASTWVVLIVCMWPAARSESIGFGLGGVGPLRYALTQCSVVLHYLRLSVWPDTLVLDYYWPVGGAMSAAFVVVGLVAITAWALSHKPRIGFWGVWFFLILAPTSSVVPIITEIAAEHRMYLPLAGVVTLFGLAVAKLRPAICATVFGIVAVTLGLETYRRNADYRSAVAIWSDTAAKRPDNPRAHNNLAQALAGEGRSQEAIHEYSEAIRLEPGFAAAHFNLGKVLSTQGNMAEAAIQFDEAARLKPGFVDARIELGMALGDLGRIDEAIAALNEALRLDPNSAQAHYNMGVALARQGQLAGAANHFQAAVTLDPEFVLARRALEDIRSRVN